MKIKTLICISLIVGSFATTAHQTPYKRNLQLEKEIQATYLSLAHSIYKDSLMGAQKLQTTIESFILRPTELTMGHAKETWTINARLPYG
ncbi:MAG: hypothetical protein NXH75_14615, partial [Halobacteriovoraceae bacterium]|nr:hypothetical protein [Halobacteriovoraceae bacterium]